MKIILNKKYIIKQIKQIKQKYNYFYILRYNNITNNKIILIKKKIQKNNLNLFICKKNILNKELLPIKIQGCLLIIYTNEYKNLLFLKNLDFILILYKNIFYSKLKTKKLLKNLNNNLNIKLINPFIFFIKILKKVSIT